MTEKLTEEQRSALLAELRDHFAELLLNQNRQKSLIAKLMRDCADKLAAPRTGRDIEEVRASLLATAELLEGSKT